MKKQKLSLRILSPLYVLSLSLGVMAVAMAADLVADSTALARIGDTEVKVDDIRASISNLSPKELSALSNDNALLNQTVHSLLVQRIVYKEAIAKKWDQQPSTVTQIEQARVNAIAESYLNSVSRPPDSYPSDAELQSVYDANKTALLKPRQYRLAQIFIALPKGADQATTGKARVKLEAVEKGLKAPDADFAAVARAESDEKQTAGIGGEMGWLIEARIPSEIRDKVTKLMTNSVAEPVRLDDGWHIVKLIETKEAYTPSLEEIKPLLSEQMRVERTKQNRQAYLAKLIEQNPVAINQLALSKILPNSDGSSRK